MTETKRPAPKILSVDDTASNLFAMRALLEPLGYEIVDASSGQEALAAVGRGEFAVVLLDVMMPGMDGLETLARLRSTPAASHTPVILITARDEDSAEIERAYSLGAVDYVSKPIRVQSLRGKIAAIVALFEANKALRDRDAALAEKDRQIAVLAHDLRNPLGTIVGGLGLLSRSVLDAKANILLDRVGRATTRMTAMIQDLLEHARSGNGVLPMTRSPMDLGEVCRGLISDFETADPERHISLTMTGNVAGEWDPARIYQALSNLVGNATHYGQGQAEIAVRDWGNEVRVSVHNHGPAITARLRPVIFEPFERGQEDGAGFGLGLYIVKAIAQGHGGEVFLESDEASGTTFTLRLPRRPPSQIRDAV